MYASSIINSPKFFCGRGAVAKVVGAVVVVLVVVVAGVVVVISSVVVDVTVVVGSGHVAHVPGHSHIVHTQSPVMLADVEAVVVAFGVQTQFIVVVVKSFCISVGYSNVIVCALCSIQIEVMRNVTYNFMLNLVLLPNS